MVNQWSIFKFKIADQDPGYSVDQLPIPAHYTDDLTSIKIPNGLILDRSVDSDASGQ